jgi:hypothetical protein
MPSVCGNRRKKGRNIGRAGFGEEGGDEMSTPSGFLATSLVLAPSI